ncbi:MAG: hypothetical protein JNM12_14485 [Alphaproteobacteria bacterium]|nr:hypothetical protein [Alphaproteobacteria bacterium]
MKFLSFLFATVLLSFPAEIYASPDQTIPSKEQRADTGAQTGIEESCKASAGVAPAVVRKIYRGIDKIVLYVPRLWTYERALQCHNKEAECVLEESKGILKSAEERKKDILSLKKNFNIFPDALYHKNLLGLFENRIKTGIIPYLNSGKGCTPPELKIITREDINLYSNDTSALHIVVKVKIFENTKPKIALLGFDYYRKDFQYTGLSAQFSQGGDTIAIPLDGPPEEIQKEVTNFVNNPRNISPFTLTE